MAAVPAYLSRYADIKATDIQCKSIRLLIFSAASAASVCLVSDRMSIVSLIPDIRVEITAPVSALLAPVAVVDRASFRPSSWTRELSEFNQRFALGFRGTAS